MRFGFPICATAHGQPGNGIGGDVVRCTFECVDGADVDDAPEVTLAHASDQTLKWFERGSWRAWEFEICESATAGDPHGERLTSVTLRNRALVNGSDNVGRWSTYKIRKPR